ncbi:hypothetical protein KKH27_00460 [bacterium]|nr:hypothetical protein [bacterium]
MPSFDDELPQFVGEVAECFDWEDFGDNDVELDILESDDVPYPYCDVVRDDTGEAFRMFVTAQPLDLNLALPDHFLLFQNLEGEFEEQDVEAVLCWRAAGEEDFWYVHRTEDGEIGLFHSDLSLDEEFEDEEEGEEEKGAQAGSW